MYCVTAADDFLNQFSFMERSLQDMNFLLLPVFNFVYSIASAETFIVYLPSDFVKTFWTSIFAENASPALYNGRIPSLFQVIMGDLYNLTDYRHRKTVQSREWLKADKTLTFLNFALSEQKELEKYNKRRINNLSLMGLQFTMSHFVLQVNKNHCTGEEWKVTCN